MCRRKYLPLGGAATIVLLALSLDMYAAEHLTMDANICWVCVGDLTHTECYNGGVNDPTVVYSGTCHPDCDAYCMKNGETGEYYHSCLPIPSSTLVCPH
jgi:hypothetical protein